MILGISLRTGQGSFKARHVTHVTNQSHTRAGPDCGAQFVGSGRGCGRRRRPRTSNFTRRRWSSCGFRCVQCFRNSFISAAPLSRRDARTKNFRTPLSESILSDLLRYSAHRLRMQVKRIISRFATMMLTTVTRERYNSRLRPTSCAFPRRSVPCRVEQGWKFMLKTSTALIGGHAYMARR
jgi:hypothetical protein